MMISSFWQVPECISCIIQTNASRLDKAIFLLSYMASNLSLSCQSNIFHYASHPDTLLNDQDTVLFMAKLECHII